MTNANEVIPQTTDAAPATTKLSPEMQKLQEVQRTTFFGADMEKAQEAINKVIEIVEAAGLEPVWQFDPAKPLPDNYGIVIMPLRTRDTKLGKLIVQNVCFAGIPSPEAIEATEGGASWIRETAINTVIDKLYNTIRTRDDDNTSPLPFSVKDFITTNRAEGVLIAFRKYAGAFVRKFRSAGFVNMDEKVLRQCLASKEYAETNLAPVPQATWVDVIERMLSTAESEGIAPGMLTEWKETRDTAGMPKVEIDLSALSFDD